ncbi:uncharacterized protein DEA37_0004072 [Paragonimus westermani]|uniref:Uncharacterized protein n=1 Tax=Paragonimus westermani TaxID=34504 RepID=A0A5J4NN78_9TREM|nr:uncharacterized protein DEA37_0004072 [Paragonimus westermani]
MEFSENVSLSMVRFLRPHETTRLIRNGNPTSQDTRGSSSDPCAHSSIGHPLTRPTAHSPFLSSSCMETLSDGGSLGLLTHSSFESLNRAAYTCRSTKRVPVKRPQALNLDKVSVGHFSCFSANLSDIGDNAWTKFSVLFGPGHFICVCQKAMQRTAETPEHRTQVSRSSCLNKSPRESPGSPKSIFHRVRSFWSHKKKLVQSTEDLYSTPSAVPNSLNTRWTSSRNTHPPLPQSKKASLFSSTDEPPSVNTGSNSSICSVPSKSDGIYRDIRQNAVVTLGVTTCDQRHAVSIAAQQAVDTIEHELNSLNWGQSQCDALNAVLLELAKLLPCRRFATEFIRKGGHEVLFHLVESFDCSDQLPTTTDIDRQLDPSPEFDVWSNLVTCLVELAEYSINSSELGADLEEAEAGDDRSSNYSRRISIDSQSSCGDSKDATLIRSASDANMNELFSWHLASQKFLPW